MVSSFIYIKLTFYYNRVSNSYNKYRLAAWQSIRTIPFTKLSLNNLEKALRALSEIWGPNVMLIKEKPISKNKKLVVEKVDIGKLSIINIFERLDYHVILNKIIYSESRILKF